MRLNYQEVKVPQVCIINKSASKACIMFLEYMVAMLTLYWRMRLNRVTWQETAPDTHRAIPYSISRYLLYY